MTTYHMPDNSPLRLGNKQRDVYNEIVLQSFRWSHASGVWAHHLVCIRASIIYRPETFWSYLFVCRERNYRRDERKRQGDNINRGLQVNKDTWWRVPSVQRRIGILRNVFKTSKFNEREKWIWQTRRVRVIVTGARGLCEYFKHLKHNGDRMKNASSGLF